MIDPEYEELFGLYREEKDPELRPYYNLWTAVLNEALWCVNGRVVAVDGYRSDYIDRTRNMRRVQWEALTWLKSERKTIGSFVWICSILNVDHAELRDTFLRRQGQIKLPTKTKR